jgi:hypothetical protein
MSSIVIAGDTSGSVTLQAPAVAGSTTLTLPATTATLATLTTPSFATTIGVGGATPSASGAGITFPASQSDSSNANTLDDYEEGTWTPNQGSGVTVVGAFTSSGKYTKIGNQVTIYGAMNGATSIAVAAVGIITSNMPFTSSAAYSGSYANGTLNQSGITQTATANLYSATTLTASNGLYFSVVYTVA